LKLWIIRLACVIGLILGLYYLAAGISDLCIRPYSGNACAGGPQVVSDSDFLVAIGISLALASSIVLAFVTMRGGSLRLNVWVVWYVRLVFVVGVSSGIIIFLGSGSGICGTFGPFGTTGTFCTSFDPYEAIGPLLTLISLVGLVRSFKTTNHRTSGTEPNLVEKAVEETKPS